MKPIAESFLLRMHRQWRENRELWPHALRADLPRIRLFAGILCTLNATVIAFNAGTSTGAARSSAVDAMIALHLESMLALGLLGFAAHVLMRRNGPHRHAAAGVSLLFTMQLLVTGIGLTLAGQAIGGDATFFVLSGLIACIAVRLRPLGAVAVFSLAGFILYLTLPWVQPDAAHPGWIQLSALAGTLVCIATATANWHQFKAAAQLHSLLDEASQALTEKQQELDYLATRDPLTGLLNRRAFLDEALQELVRAHRHPSATGLVIADLDGFKSINDRHGHPAGDAVLKHFATLLWSQVRECDICARTGGGEFAVLLPGTGSAGSRVAAEKIRQALIASPPIWQGQPLVITVSLGVAALPAQQHASVDALHSHAEAALRAAKDAGRNRVAGFGED